MIAPRASFTLALLPRRSTDQEDAMRMEAGYPVKAFVPGMAASLQSFYER